MALYPSESEKINMKSIFQKITVQKVVKGFRYLKHYGWKEFIIRLQEKMEAENVPYEPWYEKHKATAEQIEKQKKQAEKVKKEKERKLQEAVLSVKKKYGKNAMLKGMNLQEGATSVERNRQIGGHKA